jgi:hypothetical protein
MEQNMYDDTKLKLILWQMTSRPLKKAEHGRSNIAFSLA